MIDRITNGKLGLALTIAAASLCLTSAAFADDDEPAKKESAKAAANAPGRNPANADHFQMVGHPGIGWFGTSTVPYGSGTVSAPAIGVRYWLSPAMGVDVGLGFAMKSSGTEVTGGGKTTTTDDTNPHAFLLHAGLPLGFSTSDHAVILVTPELNIGSGGATKAADPNVKGDTDTNYSGFLLQIGARAGTEVHFGFMGMPNLALEGSVGLYLQHDSQTVEHNNNSAKASSTTIATSNVNNPWDFFRSSVTARYYF